MQRLPRRLRLIGDSPTLRIGIQLGIRSVASLLIRIRPITPPLAPRSEATRCIGTPPTVSGARSGVQFVEAPGSGAVAATVRAAFHRAGVRVRSSAAEIEATRPSTSWKYAIGSTPADLQLSISE